MLTEPQEKKAPAANAAAFAGATAEQIARYYDENTARFLRFGGSGETAAIHRAIWAPGVKNSEQAFLYLNQLVAQAIQPLIGPEPGRPEPAATHLLDLGCGVGGTATWLAQKLGIQVTGITNSAVQRQVASQRAEKLGLTGQCRFILADFAAAKFTGANAAPLPDLQPVQAACAIESFVHAGDGSAFFALAARQIIPGGRLVICDDFLNPPHSPQARRWIERFIRGWHLNNLLPTQKTLDLAAQAGFRLLEAHDLTPYLRSFHPLALGLVTLITRLPLRSATWHNLSGGTALQICVRRGWTKYQALVWEKL